MQITLENLTPQQAWELEIAYSEITRQAQTAKPKTTAPHRKPTSQRIRVANLKYQKRVNYPDDFISMCVEMYHIEKLNINQITQQLNAAGYKTVTGQEFRNGGVWYVVFSKQAKKFMEAMTNGTR